MRSNIPAVEIRVPGFTKLDQLELQSELKPGEVKFEEGRLSDAKHGEPITLIFVAAITSASLGVLAAWLMKDNKSERITHRVEFVDAAGNKRSETLDVDLKESKAPRADVIGALARLANIDLSALPGAQNEDSAR
jgi:hypothetical protein